MTIDFEKLAGNFVYNSNEPLLFNTSFFMYFVVLLLLAYRLVIKTKLTRIVVVTLFSLYFFYKACGWYVVFILIAAVVDFNLSNAIHRSSNVMRRKLLLVISIVLNLGFLCYFKYTDLFITTWNNFSNHQLRVLDIVIPVGISFYTFENLSYTIDVYRKHFTPVKRFIDYLFFLSFFPKLMMGPIVRAGDFIPQIYREVKLTAHDVTKGLFLIATGLFKKVVISDYIYLNLVQYVFDDPLRHTGMECLFAVYGYALVIYCDFSGYSDMAIGIAKWLGFDVSINFLAPYQSRSITEFWRRWHISLSSWLRDYLYIPLGGNRRGTVRTYVNLFITMLLGGLWHGANWTFVLWGAMHGAALAAHKKWLEIFPATTNKRNPGWLNIVFVILTFHFVCFTWIFFKADSFNEAMNFLHQIFFDFYLPGWKAFSTNYYSVLWIMLAGFVLHALPLKWNEIVIERISTWHWLYKSALLAVMVFIIIQFKQSEPVMPVYLQF